MLFPPPYVPVILLSALRLYPPTCAIQTTRSREPYALPKGKAGFRPAPSDHCPQERVTAEDAGLSTGLATLGATALPATLATAAAGTRRRRIRIGRRDRIEVELLGKAIARVGRDRLLPAATSRRWAREANDRPRICTSPSWQAYSGISYLSLRDHPSCAVQGLCERLRIVIGDSRRGSSSGRSWSASRPCAPWRSWGWC